VLDGGLEEALLHLQPLGGFLLPRVLVASTALEGWSAVFDGDARGQGVRGVSVRLARALRVPGYFVAAAPPEKKGPLPAPAGTAGGGRARN